MTAARTASKTTAIVLRTLDYGESDRIVTFYTTDFGKVKGIAKGAKRSKRRFANTLDPFCCSTLSFSQRRHGELAFLESCAMIDHFPEIRCDLDRTLYASYILELVDAFTAEGKDNPPLFTLLQGFLGLINEGAPPESLARFFEMRLLALTGYAPVLDRCLKCRQPLQEQTAYRFLPSDGGIICGSCNAADMGGAVSPGTLRTLLLARDMPLERIGRIAPTRQTAQESRRLLAAFIGHLLGKPLKTLLVLDQVRQMEPPPEFHVDTPPPSC